MSIALKGLIAGFATGIGEAMDEERKETKQRIAVRTKNAYENYVKYQEQTNALKEEIRKRDAEARQFQPDLNDEERVAIATMPNAIDLYKRALAEGRSVGDRTITLRDILKVGEQAKGMKYDDFVNALGKVEPVQQVMVEPRTGLFATSPEKQRRLMETMAGTVGVPTEQLMAFERPREAPRVEPMGALDIETMFKKEEDKEPKSQEEMLKRARAQQTKAKLAGDNSSYEQFKTMGDTIESDMTKPLKSMEDRAQRLLNAMVDAQTPEEKAKIQLELSVVQSAIKGHKLATSTEQPEGSKPKTVAAIDSSVRRYVGTRMREDMGASWYKYTEEKSIDLPDGTKFTFRGAKVDMPPDEQRKMFAAERQYMRQGLMENGYINRNGIPAYDAVREVMNNYGLSGAMPTTVAPTNIPGAAAVPSPVSVPGVAQKFTVKTPDGTIYTFPTQQAADNFKKAAGIK